MEAEKQTLKLFRLHLHHLNVVINTLANKSHYVHKNISVINNREIN